MKIIYLSLCFLVGYPVSAQSVDKDTESRVSNCLNEKIDKKEWKNLISYFEEHLIKNYYIREENTEEGYLRYVSTRAASAPPTNESLRDRDKLRQYLSDLGMIKGNALTGFPFIECFLSSGVNSKEHRENSVNKLVNLAESLQKGDLNGREIMGYLKSSLTAKDFKRDLNKKAVILLGLMEILYSEELTQGISDVNNPLLKNLSQEEKIRVMQDKIFLSYTDPRLEKQPEPVGGYEEYFKWVYANNKKLKPAGELGKYYRVIVKVTVDQNGKSEFAGVWRGVGFGFDTEANRLIANHPVQKWSPGIFKGKPVKTEVEIEVDYRLK